MFDEREEIYKIAGSLSKDSLNYALSIIRALQYGEEAAKLSFNRGTQELRRSS